MSENIVELSKDLYEFIQKGIQDDPWKMGYSEQGIEHFLSHWLAKRDLKISKASWIDLDDRHVTV